MKKIWPIIAIAIVLALALFLILRPKNKKLSFTFDPTNSAIHYETGASHAEWGKTTFDVSKDGQATYNTYKGLKLEETHTFEVSATEMTKILDVAAKNDFFSLQNNYIDPMIMDGGYSTLTINTGDQSKTVRLTNYDLPEFSAIESELYTLISTKTGKIIY